MKTAQLENKLTELKTAFDIRMTSIEKEISKLTLSVQKSNENMSTVLDDVKAFLESFTANYVPVLVWNKHVEDHKAQATEMSELKNNLHQLQEDFKDLDSGIKDQKKNSDKKFREYIYPIIMQIISIIITAGMTLVAVWITSVFKIKL